MSAVSLYFVKNILISSIVRLSHPYSPPLALTFPLSEGFLSVARDIPSRCQSPLSLPRGFPSRCHILLIINRPFPASRPSRFLPYIAGSSTTSTCLFVSPIYCHIRSLSLRCAARARQPVSTRLPISSTSLPICRLPSDSRCHPVFCRDLRIILILVCCLYAVLPYISHSLVAPLICCHAPGIARVSVCRDATSSSFAVSFHPISPFLDPFALLFAPVDPPLSAGAILVRARSCPFCCLTAACISLFARCCHGA